VFRRHSGLVAIAVLLVFFGFFVPSQVLHDLNAVDRGSFAERLARIVGFSGFQLVGALIVWRRPGHPVGWLLCAVALTANLGDLAGEYSTYALVTKPGSLPGGLVAGWFASWLWYPTLGLALIYVPLLFPDGRLPSPRWRWLAFAGAVATAALCVSFALAPNLDVTQESAPPVDNPFGIDQIKGVLDAIQAVSFPALAISIFLTAISVVLRFRGSRGDARQQLKWFAGGVLVLVLNIPVEQISPAVSSLGFAIGLLAIPTSVALAILRYRLYDIDRIINRTLVYGLLTASLALVYFGLVVGLQAAFRPVSGSSNLAIVLTTLIVAALFLPARRRLQSAVDRRFNRRAYDAALTIDAFSARLRQEIDLDTLRYELLAVVGQTMQPAGVSLWLRKPEAAR
jgi:hypothetical protein